MRGLGKFLKHFGVHGNHHVLLGFHEFITCLHLLRYPLSEGLADDSCRYVHDELLWAFLKVWLVRKVVHDVGLLRDERADVLQS